MTTKLFMCFCAVLALTGCEQPRPADEIAEAPNVPALDIPSIQAATPEPPKPAPTPEPIAEVAPPPAKPTVGSMVWATTRISVTTDDGILGIPAGTKLRVLREVENGYTVTDEKNEFAVTAGQVSLSGAAGSSAANAEATARATHAAWLASQKAAGAGQAQIARANQAIGELQNRYDMLVREEASLKAGVQRAHAEDLQAHTAANQRRVFTRSVSPSQAAAWRARLPSVQAEKDRLFYELKRARE